MRLLVGADESSTGYGLAEFRGGAGPWTVPHVHTSTDESFFVLEGGFTVTVGVEVLDAGPGDYVRVPKGSPHIIEAVAGGGAALVLWVPGGLEKMFVELASLGADAIRDPATRAEVASRHDSKPV